MFIILKYSIFYFTLSIYEITTAVRRAHPDSSGVGLCFIIRLINLLVW